MKQISEKDLLKSTSKNDKVYAWKTSDGLYPSLAFDYSYFDNCGVRVIDRSKTAGDGLNESEEDIQKNLYVANHNYELIKREPSLSGSFSDIYLLHYKGIECYLKIVRVNYLYKSIDTNAYLLRNQSKEVQIIKAINKDTGDKHVCELIDACAFKNQDGAIQSFFIITEKYEPFPSLKDTKQIDEKVLIKIMLDILYDLNYIHHRHNVWHRDIKTENLVVKKTEDSFDILLIDFNIAKNVGTCNIQNNATPIGTPSYVAPEIAKGEGFFYSDIYSVGAVVYEAITGVSPNIYWERGGYKRSEVQENLYKCCAEKGYDRKLAYIIMKSIEYSPSDRYKETGEVIEDIYSMLNITERRLQPILRGNKYYINLNQCGDIRWIGVNDPREEGIIVEEIPEGSGYEIRKLIEGKIDEVKYFEARRRIIEIDDKYGDLIECINEDKYSIVDESFFASINYIKHMSALRSNALFSTLVRDREKKGLDGVMSRKNIIQYQSGESEIVVETLLYKGKEYIYTIGVSDDCSEIRDAYSIKVLNDDGTFSKVRDGRILCNVIILMKKELEESQYYNSITNGVFSCYYSGKKQDCTKENFINVIKDGLKSKDDDVRELAQYYYGYAFLIGYGVKKNLDKAQELLNSIDEPYAEKIKKRANGRTLSNVVLFAGLLMVGVVVCYGFHLLFSNINNGSSDGISTGIWMLLFTAEIVTLEVFANWLVKKSIWDFNLPEAVQLLPVIGATGFIFYQLSYADYGKYMFSQKQVDLYPRVLLALIAVVISTMIIIGIIKLYTSVFVLEKPNKRIIRKKHNI